MASADQRLTALEKAVFALQTQAIANQTASDALTTRVGTAEKDITMIFGAIAADNAPIPGDTSSATFIQVRPVANYGAGTATNFFKEIGGHFRLGDIPANHIVEWRLADGTTVIPSQADNRVTWPDGSLKDASFTLKYPNVVASSASTTLRGYSKVGTWNNTSWATTAAITARDIRAEITISGVKYTLGANNEITRGTNVTQVRSGPHNAMWRIFGEFRAGTLGSSTPEGAVWGILYLTFFSDGTYKANCLYLPTRANQTSATSKSVSIYSLIDYVGPTTLFTYTTPFTFYAGCPVMSVNTDGLQPYTGTSVDKCVVGFPVASLGDPTTTGLYDSQATWWYKSTPTMIADLDITSPSNWVPNSSVDYPSVNGTGGHNWVGPMTYEAVAAMLSGTWSALRADRINALAVLPNSMIWPNNTTGYPYNLNNVAAANYHVYSGLGSPDSTKGWGAGATITITGGAPNITPAPGPTPYDGSHAPLYAYYQYLASGEEHWLDLLHNQVIGGLGATNPTTGQIYSRNPLINSIHKYCTTGLTNQTRGNAWNMRNGDNAQWVTPDTHPMKQYLLDQELNHFDALAEYVRPPNYPVQMATNGIFDGGEDSNGNNSPWMHDFLMISISMAIRRGRVTPLQSFVAYHIVPWVLGRAINGCPAGAYVYQMGLGTGATPQLPPANPPHGSTGWPQDWTDVWYGDGNLPNQFKVIQPGGLGSCPVSGLTSTWPFTDGNTYPAIGYAASACATIAGLATAATAYAYLHTEMVNANISEAAWAANLSAQWRIDIPA